MFRLVFTVYNVIIYAEAFCENEFVLRKASYCGVAYIRSMMSVWDENLVYDILAISRISAEAG